MKKVLFLLLVTSISYGQALFDKGIKVTTNINDTIATKVVVKSANNVYNYQDIVKFQKEKGFLSTGLIKNGLISANGDPTKFNITAGIGIISNFEDPENPISTIIRFPDFNSITPTYLTTGNITYVAINSTPAVVMQATPFTPVQRRYLILLGAVIHSNLTTINVLNNISAPSNASTNQLHDFMEAVGALNLTGNKYTENGANLQLNKSAGVLFKLGSNFAVDWRNPHQIAQTGGTAITFRYRTQNGTESADMTSISPSLYDLNNVLTTVPNNKFTIQTVTVFQTGLTRIQWGQTLYDDLQSAKNALLTRDFVVENNIRENGVTRAYIIVRNTTTSLQNIADAYISEAQKFGGVASGGVALTLANIVTALGYTPENVANKQNSLAVDGTGIKYPTVDATNAGLSLKANIDNPTFTGVLTNTNNIISTNTNGTPSRFGGTPTILLPNNIVDIITTTNVNFTGGDSHYRALLAISEFSGATSSNGTVTGLSGRGSTSPLALGDLTLSTLGGGIKGGRFSASHRGSGVVTKLSSVSAETSNSGGLLVNSVSFNAEPTYVDTGKTITSHSAFLAEGGSVLGTLTNNHGLYINPLIGGTNRWGIYQAGATDKNYFAGNTLFGTTTDNNQGVAQFNGNITISDGTLANHAVTKGQLDLKQNTLTNPITGTGTVNTIPMFTGTTTLGNSIVSQPVANRVDVAGAINISTSSLISFGGVTGLFPGIGKLGTANALTALKADGSDFVPLGYLQGNATMGYRAGINGGYSFTNIAGNPLQVGTVDTGLTRIGAGRVAVGNGNVGNITGQIIASKILANTSTDDGINAGIFNGTVTFSAGTTANQGVVKSQLDLKADLASPTFTGVPSVPNASFGTATNQIASTLFVRDNTIALNGNQTKSGILTFNHISNDNYINLSNSGTNPVLAPLQISVSNAGSGSFKYVTGSGSGDYTEITNAGKGYRVGNYSSGVAFSAESELTSTGNLFEFKNGGNLTSKFNYLGEFTSPKITMTGTIKMAEYTVATLPTPTGTAYATVTDALAPAYLGTLTGGGSVVCPVFYDGTVWRSTINSDSVSLTGNQTIGGIKTFTGPLIVSNLGGGPSRIVSADVDGKLSASSVFTHDGQIAVTNSVTANSFIKTGGTSSQFLKADGSVDESDVVRNIAKDATQGANITGTVSETILYSKLIPANTFKDGDFMNLFSRVARPSPTASSGGVNQRVRINTSNTLTGATQIAINTLTAGVNGNQVGNLSRIITLYNGFMNIFPSSTSLANDYGNFNANFVNITFDPTVDNYIFITGQLGFSGDTMYHVGTKITN